MSINNIAYFIELLKQMNLMSPHRIFFFILEMDIREKKVSNLRKTYLLGDLIGCGPHSYTIIGTEKVSGMCTFL